MVDFSLQEIQAECFGKKFSLKFVNPKAYHMVLFIVKKSAFRIVPVIFASSVLYYPYAVYHWYGFGCTSTSPYRHVDFQ